jgi:multisubunit Na+/H+ antiporter MnhE subunit
MKSTAEPRVHVPLALLVVAALAVLWIALTADLTAGQLGVGLLIGSGFVLLTGAGRGRRVPLRELPLRAGYVAFFFLVLLPYDIVRSTLSVAGAILAPAGRLRPGIVRLRLGEEVGRATVALEEHAITLTPGAVVVDYSADEHIAYIHVIDVADAEARRDGLWVRYRRLLDRAFT